MQRSYSIHNNPTNNYHVAGGLRNIYSLFNFGLFNVSNVEMLCDISFFSYIVYTNFCLGWDAKQ